MELSTAEAALAAAAADTATTDAMLLVEQEGVEDAANAVLALLEADADTAHGDVDAVRMTIATIEAAIVVTEGRIAAAAAAAAATAMAIAEARTDLTAAGAVLADLGADATHMEKLAEQSAVLMAAEAVVTALGDAATDADSAAVTMAQAAVDGLNERIETADAVALAMAVIVNVDDLTGGPFHDDVNVARNYAVGVTRDSAAAAAATVKDQKGTVFGGDDEQLVAGDAPPAINKYWSGSGFKRGSEYVAVYTDIEAPTPIPFFDIPTNGGRYTAVDADDAAPTHKVLNLVTTGTVNEDAGLSLWGGNPERLPAAPLGEHVIEFMDDQTTVDTDEDAFRGEYDGATGEFECTTDTCTVTIDSGGKVIAVGDQDSWDFTPDPRSTVNELDADYLWFGYWLQTTANDDGTSSYSFQSDSGSSEVEAYDETGFRSVEGSATYVGAAGGMYMQKEVEPDGSFDPATGVAVSGRFTAAATLDANFGGADVAVSDQFQISGTISDFMDGEKDLRWTVKLKEVDLGDASTAMFTFLGDTEGNDSKLDHGDWTGTFYDGGALNADGDARATDNMPFGVAGEFNAHFTNGHAHGAYGAKLEPE